MSDMGAAKQRMPSCSHIIFKGGLKDLCFINLVKRQSRGNLIAVYNNLKVSYQSPSGSGRRHNKTTNCEYEIFRIESRRFSAERQCSTGT